MLGSVDEALALVESHGLELGLASATVLLVLWVATRKRTPGHVAEVLALASAGRLREAGDLQLRHGHLNEAYNLYLRGEVWDRATFVAQRLGRTSDAAQHAERAGDWTQAAELYGKLERFEDAARAWVAAEKLGEAARCVEADPGASPQVRGDAWRAAFHQLRSRDDADLEELAEIAQRAHRAYLCAGVEPEAAYFAERSSADQLAKAQQPTRAVAPRVDPPEEPVTPSDDEGRYELGRKLGQGGMGSVYEARDRVLGRMVALKLLPEGVTGSGTARALFLKEAKAAAGLTHPNIVVLYDFGVLGERPFLSMELVEGGSVADRLAQRPQGLPISEVVTIARGLLTGLEFAHRNRVVHRDIKPANILLSPDNLVKLTDFGIAKILDTQRESTTMVAGTPAYMAPEQFTGKGIDQRTDIFGVGATLYELLTGLPPFESAERLIAPAPPSVHRADIPSLLDSVVLACIKSDPRARPASCTALLEVLDRVAVDGVSPTRASGSGVRPRPLALLRRPKPQLEYSSRETRGVAERRRVG